jgi:hypothetical protein
MRGFSLTMYGNPYLGIFPDLFETYSLLMKFISQENIYSGPKSVFSRCRKVSNSTFYILGSR